MLDTKKYRTSATRGGGIAKPFRNGFANHCLSFCPFSVGHYIVRTFSIYDF